MRVTTDRRAFLERSARAAALVAGGWPVRASRASGFSLARLRSAHDLLAREVERATLPGLVTLVSRGGETHADAIWRRAPSGPPMRTARDLVAILMTQRSIDQASPAQEFWKAVYRAIED